MRSLIKYKLDRVRSSDISQVLHMFLVHTNTSITYMCLPKNHKAVGTNSRNRNSNAMSLGTNKSNIRTNVISITETYKLTKYQTHERANRDTIIFDI